MSVECLGLVCGLLSQQCGDVTLHLHLARTGQTQLADPSVASRFTKGHLGLRIADSRSIAHAQIEHMAEPIAAVAAAILHSGDPSVVVEWLIRRKFDVHAPQTHLVAIDAREVGLTTDARRIPQFNV